MSFKREITILLSFFMVSCSIKENRAGCPCLLTLEIPQECTPCLLDLEGERGSVCTDTIKEGNILQIIVPREELKLAAVKCDDKDIYCSKGIRIPYGKDCPEVYMFNSVLDARGEELSRKVVLRKNFCNVKIVMKYSEDGTDDVYVVLDGNISGYDDRGCPLPGKFRSTPKSISDKILNVKIPRQKDNSIVLNICAQDKVLRTFALGRYIAAAGYDWLAEELEDITIELDYGYSNIFVDKNCWNDTVKLNVAI